MRPTIWTYSLVIAVPGAGPGTWAAVVGIGTCCAWALPSSIRKAAPAPSRGISRLRKKWHFEARYRVQSALRGEMWGTSDARWGCQKRGAVQLCELRSAGAIG